MIIIADQEGKLERVEGGTARDERKEHARRHADLEGAREDLLQQLAVVSELPVREELDFHAAGTADLTAAEFAKMLEESGIGPAVIVVSACHSGSFVDDIAAPDRLVITAARGDRTSFGCRDGAEWTEFGESFFDKALRSEPDPRKAFPTAVEDVTRKELADDLTPSLPQISEGADIGAVLDRVLTR